MTAAEIKTIDAYIAAQPEALQGVLQQVRDVIRRAIPNAAEAISYKIPAFRVAGRVAIFFAGWTSHYSVYPVTPRLASQLGDKLAAYPTSKGTVRFPLDQPVPEALITEIAILLSRDAESRAVAAKAKRAARAKA